MSCRFPIDQRNCLAGDQRADFDDSFDVSPGDPILVDDDFGFGPEVLRLPVLPRGRRLVAGVYAQPPSTGPVTTATVRVISRGRAVTTFSATLSPDTFWNAATLDVGATGVVTATAAAGLCPVGGWICTTPAGACE